MDVARMAKILHEHEGKLDSRLSEAEDEMGAFQQFRSELDGDMELLGQQVLTLTLTLTLIGDMELLGQQVCAHPHPNPNPNPNRSCSVNRCALTLTLTLTVTIAGAARSTGVRSPSP